MSRNALAFSLILGLALLAALPAAAEFRLEKELSLSDGGTFEIETDSGRIAVRGSARSGARVVITSPKDEVESRYDFTFTDGGDASVRAKRRGSAVRRWFGDRGDSLRFEVEVPASVALELRTSGGGISVREVNGRSVLHTSGGGIELEGLGGVVRAHTSGGSIRAFGLGGEALLDTSGGSVKVEDALGDLTVETSGGSISIDNAAGHVDARTSGGSVTAHLAAGNDRGGSFSTSGGRVTVYVDPSVSLDIEASSSSGRVTMDLPIAVQGRISRSRIDGTLNGGGETLRLHTSGGSVRLASL
jgi:hypothetical protein